MRIANKHDDEHGSTADFLDGAGWAPVDVDLDGWDDLSGWDPTDDYAQVEADERLFAAETPLLDSMVYDTDDVEIPASTLCNLRADRFRW